MTNTSSSRPVDPYVSFRFELELGHISIAGFNECTGLELETKVFEYREGGRNTHSLKFPERSELKNLVLKRGMTSSRELYDWCLDVASGRFQHDNQRPAAVSEDIDRRIAIVLKDADGNEAKRWALRRAFPVKWVGPELKGSENALAFETLELAHEGLEQVAS